MKLDNQELQKEFYDKVAPDYPMLTPEQVKACTMTQYIFTRKLIESGELPVVRLQYFGTFLVFRKKAEGMLRNMKIRFENLTMEAKQYFAKKAMIEKFLTKYEDDMTEEEEFEFIDDTEDAEI